eukprot:2311376-Rhodomonas_salina.1
MGQFCCRRRKHVGLAHAGPTVFHFNLLSNSLIDICGKIALTAGEAEEDPIDVEFQQLCNTIFASSVLAAKAVKWGPMAIAKGGAALLPQREGKSTSINLLASQLLPRPFRGFPNSSLLSPSDSRRGHSTVRAGAATEGARANGSVVGP